jgi:hypothetical protein
MALAVVPNNSNIRTSSWLKQNSACPNILIIVLLHFVDWHNIWQQSFMKSVTVLNKFTDSIFIWIKHFKNTSKFTFAVCRLFICRPLRIRAIDPSGVRSAQLRIHWYTNIMPQIKTSFGVQWVASSCFWWTHIYRYLRVWWLKRIQYPKCYVWKGNQRERDQL